MVIGLVTMVNLSSVQPFGGKGVGVYLLCIFLRSILGHIMSGALTVYTTAAVVKDERGTLTGLEHTINSLPTIVSPIIAGVLLRTGGGPLAAGTSVLITGSLMLAMRRQVIPRYRTKDT